MTFDELYRAILAVCPRAQLDEDMDGQIVVYTDMMIATEKPVPGGSPGTIIPYVGTDDEDDE